jgi:hypothetical protein
LSAARVNRSASARTTPANILGDLIPILGFVVARALAINIDAAVSAFHSTVSTALGEMVALPLADLCNASVVHGLRARAGANSRMHKVLTNLFCHRRSPCLVVVVVVVEIALIGRLWVLVLSDRATSSATFPTCP